MAALEERRSCGELANSGPVLIRFVSALNKRGSVRLRKHTLGMRNLDETTEHVGGPK